MCFRFTITLSCTKRRTLFELGTARDRAELTEWLQMVVSNRHFLSCTVTTYFEVVDIKMHVERSYPYPVLSSRVAFNKFWKPCVLTSSCWALSLVNCMHNLPEKENNQTRMESEIVLVINVILFNPMTTRHFNSPMPPHAISDSNRHFRHVIICSQGWSVGTGQLITACSFIMG